MGGDGQRKKIKNLLVRKWSSDLFVDAFNKAENYPKIFISSSGSTIYGDHGDEIITENTNNFNEELLIN